MSDDVQTPSTETIVEPVLTTDDNAVEVTPTETVERTFTQAELDEIVQKRINKVERKIERQRIESETRAKVTQELTQQSVDNKPLIQNFSTLESFEDALIDWRVEQKLVQVEQKRANDVIQNQHQTEQQRINEREIDTIEKGERKYDDFEEVIRGSTLRLSQAAHFAMVESDISEDLLYFMYNEKNAEEAKRITALPAYAQAKEIGKLEDKLLAKRPATPSKSPKPIEPIDGNASIVKKMQDMSPDEYIKERLKQKPRWA